MNTNQRKILSEKLKRKRLENKLSVSEMAKVSGLQMSDIFAIENNCEKISPSLITMHAICLNIPYQRVNKQEVNEKVEILYGKMNQI